MSHSIYIIAGEVSGDTHGAHLMDAMSRQLPELEFRGAGGPAMRDAGGDGVTDWVEDAAVMGFWEVLKHYRWFKCRFYEMLDEVVAWKPEALVLIDYPGFNLRFAAAVRERLPETKIIYYISPQVWAWNKGRIPKMAEVLDLMLCIFPFEKPIFESAGLETQFVGHPLVDELEDQREQVTRAEDLVGLFPGSREREVNRLFPMMVEAARRMHSHYPDWRYEAAAASKKLEGQMQVMIEEAKLPESCEIRLKTGNSHSLMQRATCGVVASGTATLEAAALGLPYCLVYKLAWPTYALGKLLVKVEYIGLVNILAGEGVVEELVQSDADPGHVERILSRLMTDREEREALCQRLERTASRLGDPGAHERAAQAIVDVLELTNK
ncbi:lipid-A-disaccharide synthase [Oceaniferula marina]|uniref:lipid-A-disaccharide synthase n=1 Tax=Oceaniferula marina TaxID=2748318 RepID=UPI0029CAA971|nr:lipid-A-disaccharide synthase [Oceaniferula marina]